MAKINVEVGVNTGAFQTGLAQMQNQTKKWKANLSTLLVGGLAGAFSFGAITSGIDKIINKADQIGDLSDRFGVAAESLQRFGNVAAQNGSSMEAVGAAFNKLIINSQAAINGNSGLQESFARLGLTIEQLQTLSPEEQMLAIADAAKNSTNPTALYADVVALLGKNGGELVPTLKKGSEAIKEFGSVMSSKEIAEITKAKDDLEAFGNEALVVGAKILRYLIPAVKSLGLVGKAIVGQGFNTDEFSKIWSNSNASEPELPQPVDLQDTVTQENENKTLDITQDRERIEQNISTVKTKSADIGINAATDESKFTDEALNTRQEIVDLRQEELDLAQQINDVEIAPDLSAASPIIPPQTQPRKAFEVKFSNINDDLLPTPNKPNLQLISGGGTTISSQAPALASSQAANPGPNIDSGLSNLGTKVTTLLDKQIGLQTQMVDHLAAIKTGVENIKLPEIGLAQFNG